MFQNDDDYFWPKVFKKKVRGKKEIGEGRLFGALFVNTATIRNQLAVHHQLITRLPHAKLCLSLNALSQEHLTRSAFSVQVASVGAERLTCTAMSNLSTALFLSQEDRKWLGFCIVCFAVSQTPNGSHLSIRHAGNSHNPPPLQIAEKQLVLFSH